MFKKLKFELNSIRQNIFSYLRKIKLKNETDLNLVKHFEIGTIQNHSWYGNSYGGFFIIPELLSEKSILYSIGIGKDISFDLKCLKKHALNIFAFDPTPKSINFIKEQKLPLNFKFYEYGITANLSGVERFFMPENPNAVSGSLISHSETNATNFIEVNMLTFDDMAKLNKHNHIDVLKMDIEGAEYDVLDSILQSEVTIDQILVEFHDRLFDLKEYKSKNIVLKMIDFGYEIYGVSKSFEEISFVHKRVLGKLKKIK